MLKKWDELPESMRTPEVKDYYNQIAKRPVWLFMKRVIDILIALFFLILLAIPMLVISVMIKCDSKGPVLFRQTRVTTYGKTFKICKFRTMVNDAEKKGTQVTVSGDARITKVGAKLRHARLDEFPQLFNILAGSMTFIGTRPEVPKYVAAYTPEMMATLLLPAGLTSRASIAYKDEERLLNASDNPDETYVNEVLPAKMKYNLDAIRHFSLAEDASCLWDTFAVVTGLKKE